MFPVDLGIVRAVSQRSVGDHVVDAIDVLDRPFESFVELVDIPKRKMVGKSELSGFPPPILPRITFSKMGRTTVASPQKKPKIPMESVASPTDNELKTSVQRTVWKPS